MAIELIYSHSLKMYVEEGSASLKCECESGCGRVGGIPNLILKLETDLFNIE